jgi:hypothetical protein
LPKSTTINNLVHDDERLSDCQKFHYLKSCLTNEALRTVESLAVSSTNYQAAYEIIQNRFKNERLIVQDHIFSILNAPVISKASDSNLRQLLDNITINLEALESLNVPVDQWGDILVAIINTKLDYNTKKDWEQTLSKDRSKFLESVAATNRSQTQQNSHNNKFQSYQKQRLRNGKMRQ